MGQSDSGDTHENYERVVKMGKNKNKKQANQESKEVKSDIDKVLDDWLNGCDEDEIPDEIDELTAKAKQKEEKAVASEPVTKAAATSEKPAESKVAPGYKA